jgi:rhamnosyl/mannosyltransferase
VRVCHLAKYYPPAAGGMETHMRTLAHAQARLGAQVWVVCVNHQDTAGRDVTWQKLGRTPAMEEFDDPVRVTRLRRLGALARLDICPALPGLVAALRRAAVDVIHLHVPNPLMLLALAAAPVRLPLVVTYHSDVVRQKTLSLALRPFEHVVLRRASQIICTSPLYPAGSVVLRRHTGKLRVVPFGIDLDPYLCPSVNARAHAEQLRAQYGAPLWLTVGRLVYYKGLDTALRALAAVPGRLLVIGEGPLEAPLRRLAADLGIADRVVWRGRVREEELVGAYHAATALWFPSNARSEAFGLVQVEAMASGLPVLNTAIPHSGVPWVSRDGETGLTVPVGDAQALAAAARLLLSDPTLRQRLGANARERAAKEFGHLTMAGQSLDLYRQAITGPEPLPSLGLIGGAIAERPRLVPVVAVS